MKSQFISFPALTVAGLLIAGGTLLPGPALSQAPAAAAPDQCAAFKYDQTAYAVCQDRMAKIKASQDAANQRDQTYVPPPAPAAPAPATPGAAPAGATGTAGTTAPTPQPAGQISTAGVPAGTISTAGTPAGTIPARAAAGTCACAINA